MAVAMLLLLVKLRGLSYPDMAGVKEEGVDRAVVLVDASDGDTGQSTEQFLLVQINCCSSTRAMALLAGSSWVGFGALETDESNAAKILKITKTDKREARDGPVWNNIVFTEQIITAEKKHNYTETRKLWRDVGTVSQSANIL